MKPGDTRSNWTFGKIIALAGDFFANPYEPISGGQSDQEREQRARYNINLLENDVPGSLVKVSQLLDSEAAELMQWHSNGLPEAQMYKSNAAKYDDEFIKATPWYMVQVPGVVNIQLSTDCWYGRIAW